MPASSQTQTQPKIKLDRRKTIGFTEDQMDWLERRAGPFRGISSVVVELVEAAKQEDQKN